MKITIHRGQKQIGGCITEIESGSGTRILIDLGHNLPEGDTPSEDKYDIPENLDELLKGNNGLQQRVNPFIRCMKPTSMDSSTCPLPLPTAAITTTSPLPTCCTER